MRNQFLVRGTLGDSFIASCKLYNDGPIIVYHNTAHKYWHKEIKQIYNTFIPQATIYFTDDTRRDLLEINSNCHLQTKDMEFFPTFKCCSGLYYIERPYIVVQTHAGKPNGGNTKKLSLGTINKLINHYEPDIKVVLIGTDKHYSDIGAYGNFVGRTGHIDGAFILIQGSQGFIGPEGLMSFFALSQKKDSIIFYRDIEAVKKRIIGTPWQEHCIDLIKMDNIIY